MVQFNYPKCKLELRLSWYKSQVTRFEKDKPDGRGMRKQCYLLLYILSLSLIQSYRYQFGKEAAVRVEVSLGDDFVRNYISDHELMKERHRRNSK